MKWKMAALAPPLLLARLFKSRGGK